MDIFVFGGIMKKFFAFFYKYGRLLDRIVYNQLEALVSWRNLLIVVSAIFCFKALKTNNAEIVIAVFAIWSVIVGFYFHLRSQADKENRTVKSRYDQEVQKDNGDDPNDKEAA